MLASIGSREHRVEKRRPAEPGLTPEVPIALILKSRDSQVLRDVRPYLRWVTRSGGAACLVSLGEPVPRSARGLLFLGGEDLAPERYGERNRHCERINEPRDAFELDLLATALKEDIPILAVCRGIQVLAVALGGTLYQDIPIAQREAGARSRVIHRGPKHTDSAHRIAIVAGSLLARLIGRRTALVNSHHHQAVRSLGPATRVVARASDGTIEAIEHASKRFVLGVQWHPERWPRPSSDAIMKGFLTACAGP
jgi:putative glutamine amidotransferase